MEDNIIVVTGASRGVGRAVVKELVVLHGRRVLAVARDAEALATLVAECAAGPGHVESLAVDLGAEGGPATVRKAVAGRRVAALINNAGLLIKRPFGEWTAVDTARLFHMNAAVPLLLTQALADVLDGDPAGHVVHISSMGGFQDSIKFPTLAAYSASKAALACIGQCLAEEFKDRGIRSNCLAIGAVDTAMLREAFPDYTAPVSPEAMGAYVARFALEGHKFFNGKVLPVALSTP